MDFSTYFRFLIALVFVLALVMGWIRVKSGSILGPWLIHATLNITMCLMVAVRTAGSIPLASL